MAFRNSEADEEDRQRAVWLNSNTTDLLSFEKNREGFLRPTLELSSQMTFPAADDIWLARFTAI